MKLTKVITVMCYWNSILVVTSELKMNFDLSQKPRIYLIKSYATFKNSFIATALEKNFSLHMSSSERN